MYVDHYNDIITDIVLTLVRLDLYLYERQQGMILAIKIYCIITFVLMIEKNVGTIFVPPSTSIATVTIYCTVGTVYCNSGIIQHSKYSFQNYSP